MTKWKLVPAGQFAELMFHLEQLESNGALPDQLEGMAESICSAPQPPRLSDDRILELTRGCAPKAILDPILFARAIERDILGGDEK